MKENILKLHHSAIKAKLFVKVEEETKGKLLIGIKQEPEETPYLKQKKQLKVAQTLETLMHDDTDYINNDSVKSHSFTDIKRLNGQTINNFMFPQTRILSINHKVLTQITKLSNKVPHIILEKI